MQPHDHEASALLSEYYDDRELAVALGKCLETIKRWRRAGTAPPVTYFGRTPRTRKAVVPEWLKAREGERNRKREFA